MLSEFVSEVVAKATAIQQMAHMDPVAGRFVDADREIPRPFLGTGDIRLVIVGQDPTVRQAESHATITTVLNLDRSGSLRAYLANLCRGLGIDLDKFT